MQNLNTSNWFEYSALIPQEILNVFKEFNIDFFDLLIQISKLPRIDEKLVIADFDDTLLSRDPQLQIWIFQDNRWSKWDEVIKKLFGSFSWFVEKFYFEQYLTKEVLRIVRDNVSMILTTWKPELQYKKINKVWLSDIPVVIVPKSYMKPVVLLKYIVDKIWYIPAKWLDIYDDRCEFFNQWWNFLSKIFGIQIDVNEVKLKWNKLDSINNKTYWINELKPLIITSDDYYNLKIA
jgi:hypothetical protein